MNAPLNAILLMLAASASAQLSPAPDRPLTLPHSGACSPSWADWFQTADVGGAEGLVAWDPDGPGPEPTSLHVGGNFNSASGVPIARAARFDGRQWRPLGAGIGTTDPAGPHAVVHAMTIFDADEGGPTPPLLVFAGDFVLAGGEPVSNIAAWDGAAWTPLGQGLSDRAEAMVVYDPDGDGPGASLLIAAGQFQQAGGIDAPGVAAWDGSAWHPLGAGIPSHNVVSLTVHDPDGAGPARPLLVAGGNFNKAGDVTVDGIAAWDGDAWSSLGPSGLTGGTVTAVRSVDLDGDGPQPPTLLAGGWFTPLDPAIAALGDQGWTILAQFYGYYLQFGPWPQIDDMAVFDPDGDGPTPAMLYVAGVFMLSDNGWDYIGVAALNDGAWQVVEDAYGDAGTASLVLADPDGDGPDPDSMYIVISNIRRLGPDGPETLGREFRGSIKSATVFDADGAGPLQPLLVAGGDDMKEDDRPLGSLASWDGQSWSSMGDIIDGVVYKVTTFDEDGAGGAPAVCYIGGYIPQIGDKKTNGIARFDGSAWRRLGTGLDRHNAQDPVVFTTLVCDPDAGGPLPSSLVVGGWFDKAGGNTAWDVAAWDGQKWHALGIGLQGNYNNGFGAVNALAEFDEDGAGPLPPRLFAGGEFLYSGPDQTRRIAMFDGQKWVEIGGGTDKPVDALATFDPDGNGPEPAMLLAAGFFKKAGDLAVHGLVRWDGAAWSADGLQVGDGMSYVDHLAVIDEDGPGPQSPVLYVRGYLGNTWWSEDTRIARWNGHEWYPPPADFFSSAGLDAVWFDEGSLGAPGLYYYPASGVDGLSSRPFARLGCPPGSACFADLDASGGVDYFDVLEFLALFAASNPAADCDNSGGLDLFDFLCFTNAFNAGC